MPHRALARPSARVAGCLALSVLALAGCGGEETSQQSSSSSSAAASSPSESASESLSASPTESGSASSSESASPSTSESAEPSSSASPTIAPGGSTLRSRLLTAAELPGFNPDFRWTQGRTAPEDPTASFGTCQKFAVTSIGAEQAVVRRFRPATAGSKDRAGELVATFPDSATARRAFAVLQSWRAQCKDRLRRWTRSEVGAAEQVSVGAGSGEWYLLTYGPVPGDRDSQFFDAQGMVRVGSRIAMVSMVSAGQDYNYERGQEPMVAAVQRAAQKLG